MRWASRGNVRKARGIGIQRHPVLVFALGLALGLALSSAESFWDLVHSGELTVSNLAFSRWSFSSGRKSAHGLWSNKQPPLGEEGWLPGPQPSDVEYFNDPTCKMGKVSSIASSPAASTVRPSSKPAVYCADRAGVGHFDAKGDRWVWKHAEECGFEWMSPAQICGLLNGWTVVFMGDSTSRRMALTLKALLGGLDDAAKSSIREFEGDVQKLPDLFGRFTDGRQNCVPANQCPRVQVAGIPKPAGGWETLKNVRSFDGGVNVGAAAATMETNGEDSSADESSEQSDDDQSDDSSAATVARRPGSSGSQKVIWRPFFVPYVAQSAGQLKVWVTHVGEFLAAVQAGQTLIDQVELMTKTTKTLVIANLGSWHLQGPKPFFVRKGARDPFARNRVALEDKSYLDEEFFMGRMRQAFAAGHVHPGKTLWVWRTMGAVNESCPRFEKEASVNDVIRQWNEKTSAAAKDNGWVVVDGFAMTLGGENGGSAADRPKRPRVDDMGYIHMRDIGRRVWLQVVMNALKGHLTMMT